MKSRRWSTGRAALYGLITMIAIGYLGGHGSMFGPLLDDPMLVIALLPLPVLFAIIALLHNVVFVGHWSAGPEETGLPEKKW